MKSIPRMNHLSVSQPVNKLALICLTSRPDYDDDHVRLPTKHAGMFNDNVLLVFNVLLVCNDNVLLVVKKPEKSNSVLFVIFVLPHIHCTGAEVNL